MSVEVHNPGDDMALVRYVAPDELRVREPFIDLFPVEPAMLATITESMRKNGYDLSKSINIWSDENVVVDGHTRLRAAIAAGINSVPICYHNFVDEDEALRYAVANQRDRRNITGADIFRCIELVHKRKTAGRPEKSASREANFGKAAEETAGVVGVSRATVERSLTVINAADEEPDLKQDVLEGRRSINGAATEVRKRKQKRKEVKIVGVEHVGTTLVGGIEEPPPVDPDPPVQPVDPDPPGPIVAEIELNDEERAWLESLPLRPLVDTRKFDLDVLVYWNFWGHFKSLRDDMLQRIGTTAPEFAGPIYAAVDRLGSMPPPDTWTLCETCQGAGRVGQEDCSKCHGGGYVIPGF